MLYRYAWYLVILAVLPSLGGIAPEIPGLNKLVLPDVFAPLRKGGAAHVPYCILVFAFFFASNWSCCSRTQVLERGLG